MHMLNGGGHYLLSVTILQAQTRRSNALVKRARLFEARLLFGEATDGKLEGAALEKEVSGALSQAAQVTMRLCESRDRRQIRLPFMS